MERLTSLLIVAGSLPFAGCASVQPIALSMDASSAHPVKVGVGRAVLPPDTQFRSAGCLRCLAAASVINPSLTACTATLKSNELATLPQQIVEHLRGRGIDARTIDDRIEPEGPARLPEPGRHRAGQGLPGVRYSLRHRQARRVAVPPVAPLQRTPRYRYVPFPPPLALPAMNSIRSAWSNRFACHAALVRNPDRVDGRQAVVRGQTFTVIITA